MKICIAGKSYIAVDVLVYVINKYGKSNILVCPNKNDNSINTWEPSLKKIAETYNIAILKLEDLYELEDIIFISLEFDRILDLNKFKSKKLFNIHFSSLPAYKGVFTSALPIINSEKNSGVTLHKIDQGIDTGNIVDKIEFKLECNETAFSLYMKYNANAFTLFKKNIDNLIREDYSSKEQSAIGASYYSKRVINYSNVEIDLNRTAYEINKQIRAFNFRPYQLPKVYGKPISHSKITKDKSIPKPGTIINEYQNSITIATIDYDLILYEDCFDNIIRDVENDYLKSLQRLKVEGYNFIEKTSNGWDLGIIAAYNGSWNALRFLLDTGYSHSSKNVNGTNLLMYTISSKKEDGKKEMIIELLLKGVNPKRVDYKNKNTIDWLKEYDRNDLLMCVNNNIQ